MLISIALAVAGSGLTIGDVTIAPAAILDARGLPDAAHDTRAVVMISPDARDPRIAAALRRTDAPCTVGGIVTPCRISGDGIIELTGFQTLTSAEIAAKAIAGKDPLPDTTDE